MSAGRARALPRRARVDAIDVLRRPVRDPVGHECLRAGFLSTHRHRRPAMLVLRSVHGGTSRLLKPALVIGKVPLFYYILHFVLIHLLAVFTCYARYGSAHWMFQSSTLANYPFTAPPGWGYSLPVV